VVAFVAVLAALWGVALARSRDDTPQKAAPATEPVARQPALRLPAALPEVGSYVRTSIGEDGDVTVAQWVRSREPVDVVELAVPRVPAGSTPPVATGVRVDAPPAVATGADSVRGRERYELDVPARVVRILYTIKGGVERSPSVRGRALARVTALDVRYAGRQGPTAIDIVGPRVRNAACTTVGDEAQPRPCGAPAGKGWQVTLTGAHRVDEVMAQVDLTAAG
jgi:hypothetical protein